MITKEVLQALEIAHADLMREYEKYFDARESANKIPLSFDAWLKAGNPEK